MLGLYCGVSQLSRSLARHATASRLGRRLPVFSVQAEYSASAVPSYFDAMQPGLLRRAIASIAADVIHVAGMYMPSRFDLFFSATVIFMRLSGAARTVELGFRSAPEAGTARAFSGDE